MKVIDQRKFNEIKNRYGHYASWAIWAEEGKRPKDNMDDLRIFDVDTNSDLLVQLNPNYILVGLNISRKIERPLRNFHGPNGGAYKIRFALKDSPLWGAYMTDIIKDFEQKVSGEVTSYLRKNRDFELENIKLFEEEIEFIGARNPIIITFGVHAYNIIEKNLSEKYEIIKIPHYSHYISKEKYREEVKSILSF